MKKAITWALMMSLLTANTSTVWANVVIDEGNQEVVQEIEEIITDLPEIQENPAPESDELQPEIEGNDQEQEPMVKAGIVLTLNSRSAMVEGEEKLLDVAPSLRGDHTYVELRFVVEQLLQGETIWHEEQGTIEIRKEGNTIVLQPGTAKAIVNGTEMDMPGAVLIESGRTLVPLRFLSEQFGVNVDYDSQTNRIQLTQGEVNPVVNTPPEAKFTFNQLNYIAGQKVQWEDQSDDADGDKIIERIWKINGEEQGKHVSLTDLFKRPEPGKYEVSLKVKDQKGAWSDWYTSSVEILENKAPVVKQIKTDKEQYAQGEKIEFKYDVDNEGWEKITDVRWTYRAYDDPDNKKIIGKPEALFTPGKYRVTLQLTDEYGNVGPIEEKIITVTNERLIGELEYKFTHGKVGDFIDNFGKINFRNYPEEVDIVRTTNQETLVMSNSPEMVTETGILYEEEIQGKGRIMIHHMNGFSEQENQTRKKRVVLMAENKGQTPVTLQLTNKVVKVPSTDQLYLGQTLLFDYLKGGASERYVIQPGEIVPLYDTNGNRWSTEEGISGLMDYETSGELTIRVAATDEGVPISQISQMNYAAQDIHPRGTFPMTEKYYQVTLDQQTPTTLILGKDDREWAVGLDGITGETVTNRGDFGISHHITVTAKEDTGIILNPRGGLFRGAIKWDDEATYLMPGVGFLPSSERAAIVGVIKAGETRTFEYMLPNGSAAPVLIGFIPKSFWDVK